MRKAAALLAVALVARTPARAQSVAEPTITLAVSAGMSRGAGLWHIANQPLMAPQGQFDTVQVGRRLTPSLTATVAMSFFRPRSHLGWTAEFGYFGTRSEQQCSGPAAWVTDPDQLNAQACGNGNRRHVASNVMGLLAGSTFRFLNQGPIQPYVRASAGFGFLGASFVETLGWVHHPSCGNPLQTCEYTFISEKTKTTGAMLASLAGGASLTFRRGYRLRFEARDFIARLPRVSAPSAPSPTGNYPAKGSAFTHLPIFTMGLDIALEQHRARRY